MLLKVKVQCKKKNNRREVPSYIALLSRAELFKAGLRWLITVLAVCEYMSFVKSWQEKGCSSQAETWQVKNILIKDFD